jgi:hypothetical protein
MGNLHCVKGSGVGEALDPQWHGNELVEAAVIRTLPGEGGGSAGKPGQPAQEGAKRLEFERWSNFVEMLPNWETEWVDDSQAAVNPGQKLRAVPTAACLFLDTDNFPHLKRGRVADELLRANKQRLEMIALRQRLGGGGAVEAGQTSTEQNGETAAQGNITQVPPSQVVDRTGSGVKRRPKEGSEREGKCAAREPDVGWITHAKVSQWNRDNPKKTFLY